MGDTSRKVKNPLLSAAGVSFPFEDFSSNALLMPVTPATSSVLQDEGEVATFVGQTQTTTPSSYPTEFNPGVNTRVEDRVNHPQNSPLVYHQPQQNPLASSEIYLTPINEPNDLTSESLQPQKQGYLSSLLSSLPNLSLASITGDRDDAASKTSVKDQPNSSLASEYNLYPPFYQPNSSYSATPFNSGSGGPPLNSAEENRSYEALVTPGTTGSWYSPDNVAQGIPAISSTPAIPPPVALPPTGTPSSSYRLGNQRRLKYAPPPDLTSNSRANNLPVNLPPQPVFPPVSAPLFQQRLLPGQNSAPLTGFGAEQAQSIIYNRESARSSPGTQETTVAHFSPASSPQNIPSRVLNTGVNPEPATPQNTPANQTLLSGFVPPAAEGGWNLSGNKGNKGQNTDDDVLREVDLSRTSPSSSITFPAPESVPEANIGSEKESPSSSSSPFAPISAARVSEKLEHLLASRKDNSVDSEADKTVKFAGVDTVLDSGATDAGSAVIGKNLKDERTTAAKYFATVSDAASTPSFYDPNKFQGQFKPPDVIPEPKIPASSLPTNRVEGYNSNSTVPATERGGSVAPIFYNPSQFHGSSNLPPNVPEIQTSFSTIGNFAGGNNPQGYFQPSNTNPGNIQFGNNNLGIHEDAPPSYYAPPSPPMAATAVPEPTGSATLDPIQMSVNPLGSTGYLNSVDNGLPNLPPSLHNLATGTSPSIKMTYRPVYQHWFHRKEVETKILWLPFSMQDSLNLEEVHNSTEITPETTVATDGGRYDVDILRRLRTPVYWSGTPNEVRRCSWFYKGPAESRYVPYEENIAARLEEEYQQACNSSIWNRRIELNNGEYIIFHSATVQVHYLQPGSPELTAPWGNNAGGTTRPRVVKRGVDEFNIDEGEPDQVDHLLFLVHGIGSVCDLKFRSVEEVVDEFRSISLQLVQSHYRTASEHGTVHKIEVLPISWHTTLHSDDTGIDKKLQAITLESIPKLRHFTNDTLSDILFYTSPIYCQTIMQTVGNEMNRLHALFKKRNPTFEGGVYLGGHSLGSLIVFDLLCHQKPPKEEEFHDKLDEEGEVGSTDTAKEDTVGPIKEMKMPILKRRLSRKISYVMGAAGTGQPYIHYPQLNFHPSAFFALGSPIGMFVTVRGIDTLGEEFALPTCPAFFNIFHPFDPVAYRVEALIHPDASKFRPKLIPHHKGRKRMHLELKETMARVGADLKQKLLDSVRSTWNSVYQLAMFHRPDNQALEREIDKVVEEQLQSASNGPETSPQQIDDSGDDVKIGKLNGGRRVDYVLQEAPFEYINEYIFALTSHVCYWESEDTMLMMLKEIYGSMGIQSDAQLPQQTLTIERASPSPLMPQANTNTSVYSNSVSSGTVSGVKFDGKSHSPAVMGMDPTAPISDRPIGPPPTSGFLRKS